MTRPIKLSASARKAIPILAFGTRVQIDRYVYEVREIDLGWAESPKVELLLQGKINKPEPKAVKEYEKTGEEKIRKTNKKRVSEKDAPRSVESSD